MKLGRIQDWDWPSLLGKRVYRKVYWSGLFIGGILRKKFIVTSVGLSRSMSRRSICAKFAWSAVIHCRFRHILGDSGPQRFFLFRANFALRGITAKLPLRYINTGWPRDSFSSLTNNKMISPINYSNEGCKCGAECKCASCTSGSCSKCECSK